jgi:hypothetical protein
MQEARERSSAKLAEIKLAWEQVVHAAGAYFPDIDQSIVQDQAFFPD